MIAERLSTRPTTGPVNTLTSWHSSKAPATAAPAGSVLSFPHSYAFPRGPQASSRGPSSSLVLMRSRRPCSPGAWCSTSETVERSSGSMSAAGAGPPLPLPWLGGACPTVVLCVLVLARFGRLGGVLVVPGSREAGSRLFRNCAGSEAASGLPWRPSAASLIDYLKALRH